MKPLGQAVINSNVRPTAFLFNDDVCERAWNKHFSDDLNRFPQLANTKLKNASKLGLQNRGTNFKANR
jgi:hypothetical protein